MLEAAITRNAAGVATPDDIQKLEKALTAIQEAIGDAVQFEVIEEASPDKAWQAMDTHLKETIEKFQQGSRHDG